VRITLIENFRVAFYAPFSFSYEECMETRFAQALM
jgi:hypothetical protein